MKLQGRTYGFIFGAVGLFSTVFAFSKTLIAPVEPLDGLSYSFVRSLFATVVLTFVMASRRLFPAAKKTLQRRLKSWLAFTLISYLASMGTHHVCRGIPHGDRPDHPEQPEPAVRRHDHCCIGQAKTRPGPCRGRDPERVRGRVAPLLARFLGRERGGPDRRRAGAGERVPERLLSLAEQAVHGRRRGPDRDRVPYQPASMPRDRVVDVTSRRGTGNYRHDPCKLGVYTLDRGVRLGLRVPVRNVGIQGQRPLAEIYSLFTTLVPIGNIALDVLISGTVLTPFRVLGAAIVIGSVVLQQVVQARSKKVLASKELLLPRAASKQPRKIKRIQKRGRSLE